MKTTYAEQLKSPKWQKKRLEIMNRDEFKCRNCKKDTDQLHVHHIVYIDGKKPWEYDNNQLVTLCENCHEIIHKNGGIKTIENGGALSVYDFLDSYTPSLYILKSIENHKGSWIIAFHEGIDFISCVLLIAKLHNYITPCDCWIEMKYYADKHIYFNLCDIISPLSK